MKETIIQFGEGNFLRGFVDYFIHILNEKKLYDGKVVVVQPIASGTADIINEQNGVYNLYLRGIENGEEISEHTEIHSISRAVNPYEDFASFLELAHNPDMRFVISNTTEAGIAYDPECGFDDEPPSSFPAKLTKLLYERYKSGLSGLVMLACELIDDNARQLEKCVFKYAQQWLLGEDFMQWLTKENEFCSTLVDRIVTGYPKTEAQKLCEKIGYTDRLLDTAEIFHLWVIEGDFEDELPLKSAGLNVIWTDDVSPYKKRKVRVLNGAHTSTVFPALLCGIETVGEAVMDSQINRFLNICLFDYIIPQLGDTEENRSFAAAVLERFQNPYINHLWNSIALNSVSKFTARVLPTITDCIASGGSLPRPFAFSLACLIEYYRNNEVLDDDFAVDLIKTGNFDEILGSDKLWGENLIAFKPLIEEATEKINSLGIREAVEWAIS